MATQSTYLQVWVIDPTATGIQWDSSKWIIIDRLIPQDAEVTIGSTGGASFGMMRKNRDDGLGDGLIADTWSPSRGQYIAIVPGGAADVSSARWIGVITEIVEKPLAGVADSVGTVRAIELGAILQGAPIRGLVQYDPDPSSFNLPQRVDGIQSANLTGLYQGQIVGNMSSNGSDYYFAATYAACSPDFVNASTKFWTPKKLINRILADCVGDSGNPLTLLPPIVFNPTADVSAYLDTPIKEVVPLFGQSIASVIDILFGSSRGMSWWVSIAPGGGSLLLNVASASSVSVGNLPAATAVNVDLKGFDIDVMLDQSGADQYDQVEVWGSPIVCCGTVSFADGTMAKGWTQAQEDAYNTAASGSAGYGSLTSSQQIVANNLVRNSGVVDDVYTRFTIPTVSSTTKLMCKDGSGSLQLLCPTVSWDNYLGQLSLSNSASDPYLPNSRINGTLPWPSGLPANGTDNRSDAQKATPAYLEPIVLIYDTFNTDAGPYLNLTNLPRNFSFPSPSITLDNRGLAIRIRMAPAHMLAYQNPPWDGTGTTPAISDVMPSGLTTSTGLNYQKLMATIAIESGQYLKVTRTRSGITTPRNILKVSRPDMACWLVRKGTVLGFTGLTLTDSAPSDTFTRNDYPAAQRLCDELSAWAFRDRRGATITCAISTPYTVPSWATIGNLIGAINEYQRDNSTLADAWKLGVSRTLNTPITSLRFTFGDSPRLAVRTADPAMPSSASFAPQISGWGGGVSVTLGGDQPTAIRRIDADVRSIAKDKKVELTVDAMRVQQPTYKQLIMATGHDFGVIDSAHYYGIIPSNSTLSSVPTLNPTLNTIYQNGLGCAYDVGDYPYGPTGGPLVWVSSCASVVIKDPMGGADITVSVPATYLLTQGTLFLAISVYYVPVSGSPGTYAKVYIPAMIGT